MRRLAERNIKMPLAFPTNVPYLRFAVTADAEDNPTLLNISSFLYDFNLLYEITRLALDPKYSEFAFADFVWFRQGRPLEDQDRLRVDRIRLESPLELVAAIILAGNGAIAAVWGVVQIVEKVSNARLNRRKLEAEVAKLEGGQLASARLPSVDDKQEIRRLLRIREAERFYERTAGRLEASSVRIKTVDVEIIPTQRTLHSEKE